MVMGMLPNMFRTWPLVALKSDIAMSHVTVSLEDLG
jgi:hypothetical protein